MQCRTHIRSHTCAFCRTAAAVWSPHSDSATNVNKLIVLHLWTVHGIQSWKLLHGDTLGHLIWVLDVRVGQTVEQSWDELIEAPGLTDPEFTVN